MHRIMPIFIVLLLIAVLAACGSEPVEFEVPASGPTETAQASPVEEDTPDAAVAEGDTAESTPIVADEPSCEDDLEVLVQPAPAAENGLPPGEAVRLSWEVLNSGTCSWDEAYALRFAGGQVAPAVTAVSLGQAVDPGEEATLSVSLITPDESGDYFGLWQLANAEGAVFGQPLEATIAVAEAAPQEEPQATAEPEHTPTAMVEPADTIAATIEPSQTPEPTQAPCAQPSTVTAEADANVRGGPGTNYNVVGFLREGGTAAVNGRAGTWWRIEMLDRAGDQYWIAGSVVSFEGDRDCVPQAPVPVPPDTPTPRPSATPLPQDSPTPISTATPVLQDQPAPTPSATPTLLPGEIPTVMPTVVPPPPPSPTSTLLPAVTPVDTPTVAPTTTITPTQMPALQPPTPTPTATGTPEYLAYCLPDLLVSNVWIDQTQIQYGAQPWTWVGYNVVNAGECSTPAGPIYLRCWANNTPCSGYMVVDGPIAPAEARQHSFAVGHDSVWPPGAYTLFIEVDYTDAIVESMEDNNFSFTISFDVVE